jgi:hypothetical protein
MASFRKHTIVKVVLWTVAALVPKPLIAQCVDTAAITSARENAAHVAQILGIADSLKRLRALQPQAGCSGQVDVHSLLLRQEILQSITASSLDVDSVISEIESEKSRLSEMRALLANRRDRSLGLLNVANLVTGAGLGIVTNALQFSDSTAQLGDQIGVGSGVGSSVLSLFVLRWQRGPMHIVGSVPNMLAPLFGRRAELNAYYPPIVLAYLNSTPAGEGADGSSRLDQLKSEWNQTGRLNDSGSNRTARQITKLTAGPHTKAKLSINDITDRIAMLNDVAARVALMKRDLAAVMRSIPSTGATCQD